MKSQKIFSIDGLLSFDGEQLASKTEYELADRCIGSIFEALRPGEAIELKEGIFKLDNEIDLT